MSNKYIPAIKHHFEDVLAMVQTGPSVKLIKADL
jgi:hypothetical protein